MKNTSMKWLGILMAFCFLIGTPAAAYADNSMTKDDGMQRNSPLSPSNGFCPVCVFQGHKVKGRDDITSDYKGKTYKFSSEENKQLFLKDPEKYTNDLDERFKALAN